MISTYNKTTSPVKKKTCKRKGEETKHEQYNKENGYERLKQLALQPGRWGRLQLGNSNSSATA